MEGGFGRGRKSNREKFEVNALDFAPKGILKTNY